MLTPPANSSGELDRPQALGDRAHDLDGGVVAADVERRGVVGGQDEACHGAGHGLAALGAVLGGDGGHGDGSAARGRRARSSPGLQADGIAAEALGAQGVVSVPPAPCRNARPLTSRLSECWSWESKTASIGPTSSALTAGPVSFVSPLSFSPGRSKVGSVSRRRPRTRAPLWGRRRAGQRGWRREKPWPAFSRSACARCRRRSPPPRRSCSATRSRSTSLTPTRSSSACGWRPIAASRSRPRRSCAGAMDGRCA